MPKQSAESETGYPIQEDSVQNRPPDSPQKLPKLLSEVTSEAAHRVDLIDAIRQAPDLDARGAAIAEAARILGKTTRTIRNMEKRVQQEGVATLGAGRKDRGQFRISQQWFNFIVATYQWGQKNGSRMNKSQVHVQIAVLAFQGETLRGKDYIDRFKGYPEVLEDLVAGKHPSRITIYKVIS